MNVKFQLIEQREQNEYGNIQDHRCLKASLSKQGGDGVQMVSALSTSLAYEHFRGDFRDGLACMPAAPPTHIRVIAQRDGPGNI